MHRPCLCPTFSQTHPACKFVIKILAVNYQTVSWWHRRLVFLNLYPYRQPTHGKLGKSLSTCSSSFKFAKAFPWKIFISAFATDIRCIPLMVGYLERKKMTKKKLYIFEYCEMNTSGYLCISNAETDIICCRKLFVGIGLIFQYFSTSIQKKNLHSGGKNFPQNWFKANQHSLFSNHFFHSFLDNFK